MTHRHELAQSESPLYACPREWMEDLDLMKRGLLTFGYKGRGPSFKMNTFPPGIMGGWNESSISHHPTQCGLGLAGG